jgi:hypothetical protein
MVLLELSANSSAASVKVTSTTRSSSRNSRSLMLRKKGRTMFSVASAVGAISAPEAVDRIAESSAPKNSTCAHKGVLSRIRLGRIRWISRPSSAANSCASEGSISSAA